MNALKTHIQYFKEQETKKHNLSSILVVFTQSEEAYGSILLGTKPETREEQGDF